MVKYCEYKDCFKEASYGDPDNKIRKTCSKHKLNNYVDVKSKKCHYLNCKTIPCYGLPGTTNGIYCLAHKLDNYVDVKSKKCQYLNCKKQPIYGLLGTTVALYCKNHKLENHVDIKNKKCQYLNCKSTPKYGLPGTSKGIYCLAHKLDNYVDVKNKKCQHSNCEKQPSYGLSGTTNGIYCLAHKLDNYVNVKSKKCQHSNCEKQPSYGLSGTTIALYCKNHKSENYINIKDKPCQYPNCTIRPNYGLLGTKNALYCKNHKLENHVDLKHKTCRYSKCKTRSSFGMPGYSSEYCSNHKLPNMIYNPTKVKTDDFKTCNLCENKIHYAQDFCSNCHTYIKLGRTIKYHEKELAIKQLLIDNNIKFIHDTIVDTACSKKRPDFRIDTKFGSIILEVDEHQHRRKSYSQECEITRMKQIFFDIGSEQLLFIRYNPDKYKPGDDEKEESNLNRQDYLIKYIKCITQKDLLFENKGGILVIYLFYDGFKRTDTNQEIYMNPYGDKPNDDIKENDIIEDFDKLNIDDN
jgi:hypothetical protein